MAAIIGHTRIQRLPPFTPSSHFFDGGKVSLQAYMDINQLRIHPNKEPDIPGACPKIVDLVIKRAISHPRLLDSSFPNRCSLVTQRTLDLIRERASCLSHMPSNHLWSLSHEWKSKPQLTGGNFCTRLHPPG